MSKTSREKTLNTLLENAASCGATDLMALAIEKGADEYKKNSKNISQRALDNCIDIGNREGFDLLIEHDATVTPQQFNNCSLYSTQHCGNDIAPDVQRHFISTLLMHNKPNPFSSKSHSRELCLIYIIEYAREDIFTLIDEAIDITSLLNPEDLVPFINRLTNRPGDKDAFKPLLIKLLDRYRPLTFPEVEGDETGFAKEVEFTKKLFQIGMSAYLEQLNEAGEITLHHKQVLDKIDSIDDFFISLDANPNIMLSEFALERLLQSEGTSELTPDDATRLIRHTDAEKYYGSVQFESILDVFAASNRIDLIKTTIDTVIPLTEVSEKVVLVYHMIFRVFKQIPSDSQAIAFLNNMLNEKRYHNTLMTIWMPETDCHYRSGSSIADWLLCAKDNPKRFSALLGILPINKHVFLRYIDRLGNRKTHSENTLEDVHRKPYLLNAILNHDALSDELKDAFRDAVAYQFEYAGRSPASAIKLLTGKKKLGDRLKGELAARFIIAKPSEQREVFAEFRNQTNTVMMMVEFLGIAPLDVIAELPINTEVRSKLLKQAC